MAGDRHVIISGGSSGIGLALAARLRREGARLSLLARDPEKLERAGARVDAGGSEVKTYPCDVSDEQSVRETLELLTSRQGDPDWLLNCAGVLAGDYFEKFSAEDFRRLMDINFFGTLHLTMVALPGLKRRKGRIINVSSMAGVTGIFGYTSYCASKHAVAGFTEALRSELAPQGVKVHLVLPPEAETPMLEEVRKSRPPETRAVAETIPALAADAVASSILANVRQGRYLIVPGGRTRLLFFLGRVFPGLERKMQDVLVRKNYQGPDGAFRKES
ncbi:MAG: SDR family NAD(P)-dependent oxidoreductase [bacterium]